MLRLLVQTILLAACRRYVGRICPAAIPNDFSKYWRSDHPGQHVDERRDHSPARERTEEALNHDHAATIELSRI